MVAAFTAKVTAPKAAPTQKLSITTPTRKRTMVAAFTTLYAPTKRPVTTTTKKPAFTT